MKFKPTIIVSKTNNRLKTIGLLIILFLSLNLSLKAKPKIIQKVGNNQADLIDFFGQLADFCVNSREISKQTRRVTNNYNRIKQRKKVTPIAFYKVKELNDKAALCMLYNGTDVLSEIIPYKKIDTIKDTIQKGDLNAIMDTFDTLKEDTRLLQNLKNLHDVTITYMSKVYPDDSNQTSESAIMP